MCVCIYIIYVYVDTTSCIKIPPLWHLGKSQFLDPRRAYMIFGLHRVAPRGLNPAGHGISHFQFFSPINVFFGLKSKTGKTRPNNTLPFVSPRARGSQGWNYHITITQHRATSDPKMVGIGHLLHTSGIAHMLQVFPCGQNKAKMTIFRVYLPEI